ncbi:ABC transporter ATP-binding protein [Mogibacterium pumilum]|uniref:ABC transporter n=1 Tax=Mogibacterium pumilum TaxID=86332 RepID=A0A223ARH9_9FIRM|nr:ABC transporter ATP-binding protein [Mogibacterium pumilum]ASS37573.1 ABC transporter [Mogibacterium pumilum]
MSIIEIKDLSKAYGSKLALSGVDLNIEKGQIVGLMGPNGSGKTTLIKIIMGLLTADAGEVMIEGEKPSEKTKAKLSYLPDKMTYPAYMTAGGLVRLYHDFFADFDKLKALSMLNDLGIEKDLKLKAMSKGTKEKVQLILTMARNAEVYLLDEPIAGVDPATRDYILRTIITNYNPEAVVVISTHLIADVESVLDDVIFIKDGEVVVHETADNLREKKGQSIDKLFREVFKC